MAEQKQQSQGSGGAKGGRKKVKKHVTDAIAHVHASFNNTIVTITDRQGNTLVLGDVGRLRLPRLAQEHAIRSSGRSREGRRRRSGAWREDGGGARQGARPRP